MEDQNKKIKELEKQISKLKKEKLFLTIFVIIVFIIQLYDILVKVIN